MNEIKIYFAPLEGITSNIFRNAFCGIYGHVDKFFISEANLSKSNDKNSNFMLCPPLL